MGGHPTVPLWPAVLALAEEQHRTGADALTAYIVGQEIQARIGAALGPEHYAKGWHQTSTVGVFGAAAAASWLLGLDAQRFGNAIGIAASSSSGLKANFGTMTKPLHAGQAAERGLLAARLAALGFTANSDAIGANQGLAQAAGNGHLDVDRLDRYDGTWLILRTLFKYHAACYLTHAGIEATLSLMPSTTVDDIRAITLFVNPSIRDVCDIEHPTTGLEAKFSLRATQAFAVHGVNTTDIASFDDVVVAEPEIQAFLDRVVIEADRSLVTTASTVVLETSSGERRATYDSGVPASDLSAQGDRLRSKFRALAAPVIGPDAAEALLHDIEQSTLLPNPPGSGRPTIR
jgi:2-methylcitrate dehydratase PrpD